MGQRAVDWWSVLPWDDSLVMEIKSKSKQEKRKGKAYSKWTIKDSFIFIDIMLTTITPKENVTPWVSAVCFSLIMTTVCDSIWMHLNMIEML